MPLSYKDRFRNIDRRTVEATRRLIAARPWRGSPDRGGPAEFAAAYAACKEWLEGVSGIYGVATPELRVGTPLAVLSGYGCYAIADNTIHLPRFSVTTLAHEFRHAWQRQKGRHVGDEEDARGWSVSLIYLADPRFYWRAVERGRLLYW
ncbi:MAG: hypothetical protein ACPLSY_04975 [Moorellaceae bacterium]